MDNYLNTRKTNRQLPSVDAKKNYRNKMARNNNYSNDNLYKRTKKTVKYKNIQKKTILVWASALD